MANTFTPEQIAQILEEFFKTVGTRQYIGARYVPIFGRKDEESIIWDNSAPYEPLTIVLYQGNSYTSRQYVPEGVEITNQEFWAQTGNYNAQIEQYRQETAHALQVAEGVQSIAESAQEGVSEIEALLPKTDFSASETVRDYIDRHDITFSTVSAMQASTDLKVGMNVRTNGFHEVGDGGAAFYYITANGNPNGMDILTLQDNLIANLVITKPYVTPEQFGAYGNKTIDDHDAIQRAIDFSYQNNLYVRLLAKDYLITSQIDISHALHVEGIDSIHTVIWCNKCSGFAMSGAPDEWIQGVIIKHLQLRQMFDSFVWPDFYGVTGYGIYTQCVNSVIEDVVCKGFNIGFYFYANVTDISIYHHLNYDGENHCANLCNAVFCNTGFIFETYDMFGSKLVAGMCHRGIQCKSAKLTDCHVWGWFEYGYIFNGEGYLSIECTNLELEACVASVSADNYDPTPVRVNGSVLINGFNLWNMGTNKYIFHLVKDNIQLMVSNLSIGNYGTIDESLTNSTVMPTIVTIDSPRSNCTAYVQGTILPLYLTGRVFINNSVNNCKCLSAIISANNECTAYHVVTLPNAGNKIAIV